MKKPRVIFHIDMNSFYASVEIAYNPKLKGKPIAIAGNPEERKGIIVTSSYEARAKGVKTTMPIWEARQLCPNLLVIRPNFNRYREVSRKIFALLYEITPLIEPVSIDEGYMDVTDLSIHPVTLAQDIQQKLLSKLKIPCSIGIGPNKFLAKTASDMKKPLGITVLRKRELADKLWPLSIDQMYGVGKKTAEKLHKINIRTIGDLAAADTYALRQLLGVNGERLQNRANGHDKRKVDPNSIHEHKSIGNSQTLREDTTDIPFIEQVLLQLTKRVDERLKRRELTGKVIQLTIRYKDLQTITRSRKVMSYVDGVDDIYPVIEELLHQHWNLQPIRLLGVTVSELLEKSAVLEQLNIFTYKEQEKKLIAKSTLQQLREKYGEETFPILNQKDTHSSNHEKDSKFLRTSFQKDFLDDFRKYSSDDKEE